MNDDWPLFLITFTATRNNFKRKLGEKIEYNYQVNGHQAHWHLMRQHTSHMSD
jgi:hypothetical protein